MEPDVERRILEAVAGLEEAGATIEEVSLPHTDYGLATYYIVAPAEASANLARYDGIRFGPRLGDGDVLGNYLATRGRGFGAEVKRRIMLGTYALSAGYYDAYYLKAQKVRTLIKRDFDVLWEQGFDALVAPTSRLRRIPPCRRRSNGRRRSPALTRDDGGGSAAARRAGARRARPGGAAVRDPQVLRHPRDDGRRHQPRGRGAGLRHAGADRRRRRALAPRRPDPLHLQLRHDRAATGTGGAPRGPLRRRLRLGNGAAHHRRGLRGGRSRSACNMRSGRRGDPPRTVLRCLRPRHRV